MALTMMRAVIGGIALALAAPATAQMQVRAPDGAEEVLLRNGQFVWLEDRPQPAAYGGNDVTLLISIPAQMAYVYRGGMLIGASTVSTGKRGKDTPIGEFTILQKKAFHRSNIYSNAPMPFMQRLTWTGIALHAGALPGYPASHGCIRFPAAFAKQLFAITSMGGSVSVVDYEIVDPRVRRGVPRLVPEVMAKRADPPFLKADAAVFRAGDYDVVTASNDVIIPAVASGSIATQQDGVVFERPRPVVQKVPRRRR